jgi:hypothetical protein
MKDYVRSEARCVLAHLISILRGKLPRMAEHFFIRTFNIRLARLRKVKLDALCSAHVVF